MRLRVCLIPMALIASTVFGCSNEDSGGAKSSGGAAGSNATGGSATGGSTGGGNGGSGGMTGGFGGVVGGGGASGGSSGTSGAGGTGVVLKAPCRGLMTRQGTPPGGMPFIDAMVAYVLWKNLEPSDQDFTGSDWATIDAAVASGRAVRIRVMAGIHAPDFVKGLVGPAVSDVADGIDCSTSGGIAVINPPSGQKGCVPYFWKDAVLNQYRQLMEELAKRYENAKEVREVVDSACMTIFAEPFYRAHADAGSNARLYGAGLNASTDLYCHQQAIDIHDQTFVTIRTSLAINSWDIMDPTAPSGRKIDWPSAKAFADSSRTKLGGRLVFQNNGLGETDACPANQNPNTNYFCYLASIEGPKGFQTETWTNLGSTPSGLFQAIDNGLGMGANFIELPSGFQVANQSQLAQDDTALEATPCCLP